MNAYLVNDKIEETRINEAVDLDELAERFYIDLTQTESGMDQIITAMADEDLRGLEALAFNAGMTSRLDDEIPLGAAVDIITAPPGKLTAGQRQMWFALDEMAGRLAYEQAVKASKTRHTD